MSKFVKRIARVLDISKDDVENKLQHMSIDQTMDIVSALNKHDKESLMKIFKPSEKESVSESVMGMASLAGLRRMAELAGMNPEACAEPIQVNHIGTVSQDQEQEQVDIACGPNGAEPISSIDQALTYLEENIPNMRIADLKVIRPRLEGLFKCLNENEDAPRKKRPL